MSLTCWNKLTVLGDVAPFVEKAHGLQAVFALTEREKAHGAMPEAATTSRLSFHALHPVPPEMLAAGFSTQSILWEHEEWGCKWGASELDVSQPSDREVRYVFETPSAPPRGLLRKVALDFPDLTFLLSFGHQMPGRGRGVWHQGKRLLPWTATLEEPKLRLGVKREGEWVKHYLDEHDDWVDELKGRLVASPPHGTPPDLLPMEFSVLRHKKREFAFDPPLKLAVTFDKSDPSFLCAEEVELNIHAFALTRQKLAVEVAEQVALVWDEYACAEPDKLAKKAKLLRTAALARMKVRAL